MSTAKMTRNDLVREIRRLTGENQESWNTINTLRGQIGELQNKLRAAEADALTAANRAALDLQQRNDAVDLLKEAIVLDAVERYRRARIQSNR
jgi:predicted  nucleic acid-binding Zn-ribbon protein